MKRIVLLLLLIFPAYLHAYDFGVSLNQELGYGGTGGDNEMDYTGGLIPWFSSSLGNSCDLYISAFVKVVYEYEQTVFLGELLRTELSWRFDNFKIKLGRIPYAAPQDFIAEGFFDGAQVLYDTKIGTFYAGGLYTGLLYKKSANITMTPEDTLLYYTLLDYDKFSDTYFASRRMLAVVGWEYPEIAGKIRGKAALLGQIDLNNVDNPYNSMYISAKAAIPVKQFIISTGISAQVAKPNKETEIGLAGELGVLWIMPTSFYSQFSLIGRFSSGKTDSLSPFIPITTAPQGSVLQAKLSGLSAFFMDYYLKPGSTVAAGLTISYFYLNDKGTFTSYPLNSADTGGSALGGELFGRMVWNPLTDLSLSMGAGIFLPSMGNANPKADKQWRLELGLILILY